jgi:hypothetical protein
VWAGWRGALTCVDQELLVALEVAPDGAHHNHCNDGAHHDHNHERVEDGEPVDLCVCVCVVVVCVGGGEGGGEGCMLMKWAQGCERKARGLASGGCQMVCFTRARPTHTLPPGILRYASQRVAHVIELVSQ